MKRIIARIRMILFLCATGAPPARRSLFASNECANPAAHLEAPSCEACASQTIDLGPASNGEIAELLVPPRLPVDFSRVHLNLQNGAIRGGSYTVRNNSQSGLVTLVTLWRFQGDGPGSPQATATDVIDSWASDSPFLIPQGEQQYD